MILLLTAFFQDASYSVAVQESATILLHFLSLAPQLLRTHLVPQVIKSFAELGACKLVCSQLLESDGLTAAR